MNHSGILFQFPDESAARLSSDTLRELGYEPQLHEGGRVHIHVRDEDLTSALEIAQCYGGDLVERAPAEVVTVSADAYGLDAIPIPAHTVNEDWAEHYGDGRTSLDAEEAYGMQDDDRAEHGAFDYFEAT